MGKYDDWPPELMPIEKKVVNDLLEALSISQAVMDELTGKENLTEKIKEIIRDYKDCAIKEYQHAVTDAIATRFTEALRPMIAKWLEGFMPPHYGIAQALRAYPADVSTGVKCQDQIRKGQSA